MNFQSIKIDLKLLKLECCVKAAHAPSMSSLNLLFRPVFFEAGSQTSQWLDYYYIFRIGDIILGERTLGTGCSLRRMVVEWSWSALPLKPVYLKPVLLIWKKIQVRPVLSPILRPISIMTSSTHWTNQWPEFCFPVFLQEVPFLKKKRTALHIFLTFFLMCSRHVFICSSWGNTRERQWNGASLDFSEKLSEVMDWSAWPTDSKYRTKLALATIRPLNDTTWRHKTYEN